MRALVTGGAGFIGSAVVRALIARGDDVRVLDNFATSGREDAPAGADLFEADIRDLESIAPAFKDRDVVFHLAAIPRVGRSVEDPVLVTECNVLGTLNVLMGAERAGVRRVVYASSSSVYGDRGEQISSEDMRPEPQSPYAASKLAGEHYCVVWSRLGRVETVSLRYFNVFGPGLGLGPYALVFASFSNALLAGEAPELHWDGEQAKDFTYIDDAVRATLLAAEADADGAVINVGGGSPKSVNTVLRSISEAVGVWIEPKRLPKREGDVRHTHADITKAKKLLGWSPETDWSTAVAETVAWFRAR
jgi:nucleoside-diphosphate-sugar epimerase